MKIDKQRLAAAAADVETMKAGDTVVMAVAVMDADSVVAEVAEEVDMAVEAAAVAAAVAKTTMNEAPKK